MTQVIHPFPAPTTEEERRRALAKIYSLLIRLADRAEKCAAPSDDNSEEEPISTISVPLQNNIPS